VGYNTLLHVIQLIIKRKALVAFFCTSPHKIFENSQLNIDRLLCIFYRFNVQKKMSCDISQLLILIKWDQLY
jgi:hypothetical protein